MLYQPQPRQPARAKTLTATSARTIARTLENEIPFMEALLWGLGNMRARESLEGAVRRLAAFRLYFPQIAVRIALHLGDTTATADVNGLSLDGHGDGRSHAAQFMTRDRTGFLSSVGALHRRRRTVRRDRIASACRQCGRDSGGIGASRYGRRIIGCRPSTASTAPTVAATTAAVLAVAATAAANQQHERYQRNNQEPTVGTGEAMQPCHPQTSLSGRYVVAVWRRGSRFVVILGNAKTLPSVLLLHPARRARHGCNDGVRKSAGDTQGSRIFQVKRHLSIHPVFPPLHRGGHCNRSAIEGKRNLREQKTRVMPGRRRQ